MRRVLLMFVQQQLRMLIHSGQEACGRDSVVLFLVICYPLWTNKTPLWLWFLIVQCILNLLPLSSFLEAAFESIRVSNSHTLRTGTSYFATRGDWLCNQHWIAVACLQNSVGNIWGTAWIISRTHFHACRSFGGRIEVPYWEVVYKRTWLSARKSSQHPLACQDAMTEISQLAFYAYGIDEEISASVVVTGGDHSSTAICLSLLC